MEKLLSEMKMENKYNRTIRKEDLDSGMEYTIPGMKCIKLNTERNSLSLVILMVDLFVPRRVDSKAVDFEKKFKELDKGMILKIIERKIKMIKII